MTAEDWAFELLRRTGSIQVLTPESASKAFGKLDNAIQNLRKATAAGTKLVVPIRIDGHMNPEVNRYLLDQQRRIA